MDKKEMMGVTFNGTVTFNGPMFDIHDNEHVTIVNDRQRQENKVEDVEENAGAPMPDVLASEEAQIYWARLQEAGFTDADHQLLSDVSRKQAMYIALTFAEKLNLTSKWKPFEQLWNKRNLAQEKWNMTETGIMPSRYEEIEELFEE